MKQLIARVSRLLTSPKTEWDVIDGEAVEPNKLATSYVAPLAAIPAIAIVAGLSIIGVEINGNQFRAPIVEVLASALLFYTLTVGGVFVFAHVINWIAPRFGAERNYRQAFKVSAYSITAAMVAAALAIVPALGVFALLGGSYSLYLLFLGVPKVMHAPDKSAVNYAIVATFSALALGLVVGLATMAAASSSGNLLPQLARLPDFGGTEKAEPGAAVELGSAPLPASAGKLAAGAPAVASGGDLRGAAPLKLLGLDRVVVGVERSGLPGARTVEIEAEYRKGRRYLSLQLVLSQAVAQEIGFGGPATSEFDRETTDGYARRRRVGDAIVVEDWNNTSGSGSYGRLVEDKFYVKAAGGGGVSPQELRSVVELFGRQTLAQMEAES
jgi:Yip1 domain